MSGGSKKQTVGYRYYASIHMVLCHGPIDELVMIEVDKRRAWLGPAKPELDVSQSTRIEIDKPELFGGDEREGGVKGKIDILFGYPTQVVSSFLRDKIGSTLVPAYRGVTSLILRNMYLGNNPYLKGWTFLVKRIHTRGNGLVQWYNEKAEILVSPADSGNYRVFRENFDDGLSTYMIPDTTYTTNNEFDVNGKPVYKLSSVSDGQETYVSITHDEYNHATTGDDGYSGTRCVKEVSPAFSMRSISFLMMVTHVEPQEGMSLTVGDGAFSIQAIPHSDVDSQRRVRVCGQLTNVTLNTTSPYRFTGEIIDGNLYYEIHDSLGLMVDSGQVADIPNVFVNNINFRRGPGEFQSVAAYADIEISGFISGREPEYADMNPVHIIRECLTSPIGRGLPESEIGSSYYDAADTLYEEELGLSMKWVDETPVEDFISEVMRHIDAVRYEDPETGLQEIKLIRGDYDVATLPVLDRSNSQVVKLETPAFSELTNQVTVKYWNREADMNSSITVQDTAAITAVGTVVNKTYDYPGITNDRVAAMVAQRDLAANSRPFARGTVITNRNAYNLKPGDVFKLSDPDNGVSELVCRVAKRSDNGLLNGEITIEFGEDVFGSDYAVFSTPTPSGSVDPVGPPINFDHVAAYELPYVQLVEEVGDNYIDQVAPETCYFAFAGTPPSKGAHLNYRLYSYPSGQSQPPTFEAATSCNFTPYAVVDGDINDPSETTVPVSAVDGVQSLAPGTLVLIGSGLDSEVELASLSSGIDADSVTVQITRGVADTTPKPIPNGTVLYFIGEDYGSTETEYLQGEVVEGYGAPINGQGTYSGPYTYLTLEMQARRDRPYPPANLMVNGSRPWTTIIKNEDVNQITITWNHRDRVLQSDQMVSWFEDSDYGPEQGQTYHIEIDALGADSDVIASNYVDLDLGTVKSYLLDLTVDTPPVDTTYLEIRVFSVRDGLRSLQPVSSRVKFTLNAPSALTATNV